MNDFGRGRFGILGRSGMLRLKGAVTVVGVQEGFGIGNAEYHQHQNSEDKECKSLHGAHFDWLA